MASELYPSVTGQLTNSLTYCMEQSPSLEANSSYPLLLRNPKVITVFTRARRWILTIPHPHTLFI